MSAPGTIPADPPAKPDTKSGIRKAARAQRAAADVLSRVPLFASLPRDAIENLARSCELRDFAPGEHLLAELETGEEAFVVLEGKAKVTVGGWSDEPPVELSEIGAGDCVGEMALVTDELRAATVTASEPVRALVIERARFLALLQRHPSMGAYLAGVIANRLRNAESVLSTILDPNRTDHERREALRQSRQRGTQRLTTAVQVAWRELVVSHLNELPFLMLVSFAGAVALARSAIHVMRATETAHLVVLLRMSYVLGIVLLVISGMSSLLVFRPATRRVLACLFGAGMALLFNALPVLLSFDLFYRDIFTPDPTLVFSVETLYDRSEGAYVGILAAAVLLQAVYLRRFWRRLFTLLSLRLTRSLKRA